LGLRKLYGILYRLFEKGKSWEGPTGGKTLASLEGERLGLPWDEKKKRESITHRKKYRRIIVRALAADGGGPQKNLARGVTKKNK